MVWGRVRACAGDDSQQSLEERDRKGLEDEIMPIRSQTIFEMTISRARMRADGVHHANDCFRHTRDER